MLGDDRVAMCGVLCVEVPRHALQVAVDTEALGAGDDVIDGGTGRRRHQARSLRAERGGDLCVTRVDRFGDVCRRPGGDSASDLSRFEERDALSGLGESQGGRDSGDARADNGHVDLEIVGECRIDRRGRVGVPEGGGTRVHLVSSKCV